MPARNSKGQFVRGSGGATRKRKSGGRKRKSVALVRYAPPVHHAHHRTHHVSAARPIVIEQRHSSGKRRGGKRKGSATVTIGKLVIAGLTLGSVAETNNGPLGAPIYNLVQKLPGVKTFGGAVTAGLYLGGLSKIGMFGRGQLGGYLRAAGAIGLAGALLKIGAQGTKFQWLGGGSEADRGPFRYGP